MVEKQKLKKIIAEYQKFASSVKFIPRDQNVVSQHGAVMVGLRRVGKSYMLYQIMSQLVEQGHSWNEFLYVNFEDERLDSFALDDFDSLKTSYEEMYDTRPIFFLDEVHVVSGWEKFVRRLADQKYMLYITGSNARMLSGDISSRLGGRLMEHHIRPFSFDEFLRAKNVEVDVTWEYSQASLLAKEAAEYLYNGGMPEVLFAPAHQKRAELSNQFNAIFFRDILTRYSIRGEAALRTMLRKLAEGVMQPVAYARLAHVVSSSGQKVKAETIASYMAYVIESLMVFPLENMAAPLSERTTIRKYYFADPGFLQLFVFNPVAHQLENLVASTLYARYGDELYYYNCNIEVDFVVPSVGLAVQVSVEMTESDTFTRECSALVKLLNYNSNIQKLQIVTLHDDKEIVFESQSISVIPLWKWLRNV